MEGLGAIAAVAAVVFSIIVAVVTAARLWGKAEQRFDGIDRSLERIETGKSAVCVAHGERLRAVEADVARHQGWLLDHGDRLVRLEAVSDDG